MKLTSVSVVAVLLVAEIRGEVAAPGRRMCSGVEDWTETPVECGANIAAAIRTRRSRRLIDLAEFLFGEIWAYMLLNLP